MLIYNSKTEEQFYTGLFTTSQSELTELKEAVAASAGPLLNKVLPISRQRAIRLNALLQTLMNMINKTLQRKSKLEKVMFLEEILANAKEYRYAQSKVFNKDLKDQAAYKKYRGSDEYLTDLKNAGNFTKYRQTKQFKHELKKISAPDLERLIANQNRYYLYTLIDKLNTNKKRLVPTKAAAVPRVNKVKKKLTAPIIARFCTIIDDLLIIPKDEAESKPTFCSRVCEQFRLPYAKRTRHYFPNWKIRYDKDVKDLILPKIKSEVAKTITEFIDKKLPSKPKMFA